MSTEGGQSSMCGSNVYGFNLVSYVSYVLWFKVGKADASLVPLFGREHAC